MNNLNRDNDKIDDYFFLIIKQALEKKYYLIFFIIITFAYAIYQYSNKTFYKSDYIIKKNENIDISLNKIFSSLTDTNNRFEVLNKFVSTQKANEETNDLLRQFLERELYDFNETEELGFVSIINKNKLTGFNIELTGFNIGFKNRGIFVDYLNKLNTNIEIHNLNPSDSNYQLKLLGTGKGDVSISEDSFKIVQIVSVKLLNHNEIMEKELSFINSSILSKINNDLKIQTEVRKKYFNEVTDQALNFMTFYKSKYKDDENTEVNLSIQDYYVNQIKKLVEEEFENIELYEKLLSDMKIYELVNTTYQVAYSDKDIKEIFILPLIVLIIFMALIILFNLYNSYYSYINKKN